jgi:hypothetical protein
MEFLSEIWVWIATALGGVSLTGVIVGVICAVLKGSFRKAISKINVEKIAETATEKGIEKVKKIAFTHNIQPLVESGLEKVNEKSTELVKKELQEVRAGYNKIVDILDKLSAYFDDSIGITEDKKKALKNALEEAKDQSVEVESVIVEETTENNTKANTSPIMASNSTIKVER